jgi:hypothetical protein
MGKLENLCIKKTEKSPSVKFSNGVLDINGISTVDDAAEFYKPVLDYLERYSKNPVALTQVNIKFTYFKTNTSAALLHIFHKLEEIYKRKDEVIINWNYKEGDEDMLEAGEDFYSILRVPFKLCSYKD